MVTAEEINNLVVKAKAFGVEETAKLLEAQSDGCVDCKDSSQIVMSSMLSKSLAGRVSRNIIDGTTLSLYGCLKKMLINYAGIFTLDPNAYVPNTIISLNGGGADVYWENILGDPTNNSALMALLATKADIGDGIITPVTVEIVNGEAVVEAVDGDEIKWKIGTVAVTVASPQTLPIDEAQDNYFRKDWIAMTVTGLVVVKGTESLNFVNPPNLSAGQIGLVVIDIYGDQINSSNPQPPIDISAPPFVVYGTQPFGKYLPGQTVPGAASVAEQIRDAYQNVLPPNYVAPSASLSATPSTTAYEQGSVIPNISLDGNFVQNNAGPVTSISFKKNGVEVATTEDFTDSSVAVPVTYSVQFNYAQGDVINNLAGLPDPRGRIEAGNLVRTFSITTFLRMFYGNRATAPTTSAQVRALPQSNPANNGTYTLNTGNTDTVFAIWVPSGKTLVSVVDLDALNLVITSQYSGSSLSVNDAGGNPVNGTLYVMSQSVPYASSHRHQFIIGNA